MGIIAGTILGGRANVGLILEEPTRKERAEKLSSQPGSCKISL